MLDSKRYVWRYSVEHCLNTLAKQQWQSRTLHMIHWVFKIALEALWEVSDQSALYWVTCGRLRWFVLLVQNVRSQSISPFLALGSRRTIENLYCICTSSKKRMFTIREVPKISNPFQKNVKRQYNRCDYDLNLCAFAYIPSKCYPASMRNHTMTFRPQHRNSIFFKCIICILIVIMLIWISIKCGI